MVTNVCRNEELHNIIIIMSSSSSNTTTERYTCYCWLIGNQLDNYSNTSKEDSVKREEEDERKWDIICEENGRKHMKVMTVFSLTWPRVGASADPW